MNEILKKLFANEITESAIEEIEKKYPKGLELDMKNEDIFKAGRKTQTEKNNTTKKINERRIEANNELTQFGNELIARVESAYLPVVSQFRIEDARRKDAKAKEEKERAELLAAESKRINAISEHIADCRGKGSDYIQGIIEAIDLIETDVFDKELIHLAIEVKKTTLVALAQLLTDTIASEKVESEREVLRKQKAEADKKQRLAEQAQLITDRINKLKMIPTEFFGKPSGKIQHKISCLEGFEITKENFADRVEEVIQAKIVVIKTLTQMRDSKIQIEDVELSETKRLEAEEDQKSKDLEEDNEIKIQSEQEKIAEDIITTGSGFSKNGKRVAPEDVLQESLEHHQEEANQPLEARVTIVHIESFLKWELTREKALDDFGYLLLSGDSRLEQEALDNIKTDFKTFTGS